MCKSKRQDLLYMGIVTDKNVKNGCIESFNGNLRDELLNGEIFNIILDARVITQNWRKHYYQIRPHSSLGYRPPSSESILPFQIAIT